MGAISSMCDGNDKNKALMAETGAIPLVTELLRAANGMMREHAITAVAHLAALPSNRPILAEPCLSVIPKLVEDLESLFPKLKHMASLPCTTSHYLPLLNCLPKTRMPIVRGRKCESAAFPSSPKQHQRAKLLVDAA